MKCFGKKYMIHRIQLCKLHGEKTFNNNVHVQENFAAKDASCHSAITLRFSRCMYMYSCLNSAGLKLHYIYCKEMLLTYIKRI